MQLVAFETIFGIKPRFMTHPRLPAHIETGAILRQAQADGGFGTIVARGEKDAGTILVLTMTRGKNVMLWERMPNLDGPRLFSEAKLQDPDNPLEFSEYLARRQSQDSDLWIVEVEIDDPQSFMARRVNRVDY